MDVQKNIISKMNELLGKVDKKFLIILDGIDVRFSILNINQSWVENFISLAKKRRLD